MPDVTYFVAANSENAFADVGGDGRKDSGVLVESE
jgi:hypothetical protein